MSKPPCSAGPERTAKVKELRAREKTKESLVRKDTVRRLEGGKMSWCFETIRRHQAPFQRRDCLETARGVSRPNCHQNFFRRRPSEICLSRDHVLVSPLARTMFD